MSLICLCARFLLMVGDEGKEGYYRHSMVRLSRLRFQLIPGNAARHEGTAEPNHDAANLSHVIEVARITQNAE